MYCISLFLKSNKIITQIVKDLVSQKMIVEIFLWHLSKVFYQHMIACANPYNKAEFFFKIKEEQSEMHCA